MLSLEPGIAPEQAEGVNVSLPEHVYRFHSADLPSGEYQHHLVT